MVAVPETSWRVGEVLSSSFTVQPSGIMLDGASEYDKFSTSSFTCFCEQVLPTQQHTPAPHTQAQYMSAATWWHWHHQYCLLGSTYVRLTAGPLHPVQALLHMLNWSVDCVLSTASLLSSSKLVKFNSSSELKTDTSNILTSFNTPTHILGKIQYFQRDPWDFKFLNPGIRKTSPGLQSLVTVPQ